MQNANGGCSHDGANGTADRGAASLPGLNPLCFPQAREGRGARSEVPARAAPRARLWLSETRRSGGGVPQTRFERVSRQVRDAVDAAEERADAARGRREAAGVRLTVLRERPRPPRDSRQAVERADNAADAARSARGRAVDSFKHAAAAHEAAARAHECAAEVAERGGDVDRATSHWQAAQHDHAAARADLSRVRKASA